VSTSPSTPISSQPTGVSRVPISMGPLYPRRAGVPGRIRTPRSLAPVPSDEPYRAWVLRVERVVPRVARITLAGDALRELPTPTPGGHIPVSVGPDQPA